jgi:hypothetical protein
LSEEEEPRAAAGEGPARLDEVLHPLPARRHGQDPEVRDAEVALVKPLPSCPLVREELAEKARLRESPSRDRHRASVGFEEEEGAVPAFRLILEVKALGDG